MLILPIKCLKFLFVFGLFQMDLMFVWFNIEILKPLCFVLMIMNAVFYDQVFLGILCLVAYQNAFILTFATVQVLIVVWLV
jgi:hypothetical protein